MTTMDRMQHVLHSRVPGVELELDRPEHGGGSWWLDARLGSASVTVEWRASMGFGVSSLPSEGFGDGPDEFYSDQQEALARVEHLLRTGERTRPPAQMALKQLREARNVSQAELAERMDVTQGAVSKIERSLNPSISMLKEWVRALGGELEISARFERGSVKVRL